MATYSGYDFLKGPIRALLKKIFDVSSGHDHDGTNSKSVTTGTPSANSITASMIQSDAVTTAKILAENVTAAKLAADAVTTAKILDANVTAAKLAADAVTTAKILDANVTAAKLAADAVTTAKILDSNVTAAKLAAAAKTDTIIYQVANLAAGEDIAATGIFVCPAGIGITISKCQIISQGTAADIDDSNTCVITVSNGANAIVTKTYNSSVTFPADGTAGDLGTLSGTYKVLAAGEILKYAVTNGTSADPPAFMLQITYTVTDA